MLRPSAVACEALCGCHLEELTAIGSGIDADRHLLVEGHIVAMMQPYGEHGMCGIGEVYARRTEACLTRTIGQVGHNEHHLIVVLSGNLLVVGRVLVNRPSCSRRDACSNPGTILCTIACPRLFEGQFVRCACYNTNIEEF